ncbi:serine peptidase [Thiomicrorhabdus immobilis]|uniref:Probable periplasmic serine endoprotease DegP-like n=1 Tax=Thiomicrorhabdus immobilis TaxID=2791037 RepID=A0ABN6CZQ9_9GAMM|nr:DegQ family serine endoprotease [Thiomicrorhabdus immobilis]BCN93154.1 serine peptidase [Thiomicrorhabdus immobilis]
MRKLSIFFSVVISALVVLQPINSYAAKANEFGLPDFSQLVEDTNQSVVNISTTKMIERQAMPEFRGMPEEMLRHFFGLPQLRGEPRGQLPEKPQKEESHSLGSGFIISEDGYILTNNHVIDGADEIIVRMRNRKELVAKVIGTDPRTDVALIKIDADDLPYAKIGKSSDLKVGQWVLAIGEPFGLDFTATHGIISALGRALPDDTYVPFIQTDVAINPGNSGGPLFNLDGEVVGINSQIYSKTGGSMGLSFSIPIDIAMNVVQQLKSEGKVTRGYLGVQIQEVTNDLAKSFDLAKPQGALVGQTYPGTAAEKAGIESGDIILEFDGKEIKKSTDLPPIVGMTPIDKKVKVKILRQGKEKYFTVKLSSLDKADQVAANSSGKTYSNNRLGALVKELDKETLQSLNLPFGVVVTDVQGGPAQKAGIQAGDIIVTIDFKPVKTAEDLKRMMKTLPKNRSLPVRVVRDNRSLFLPLVLDK